MITQTEPKTTHEGLQIMGKELVPANDQPEHAAEEFQASGKYEYGYHPAAELTLQIFNTKTMSSSFFTGQEAFDLLCYLERHRSLIEEAARKYTEHAHHAYEQQGLEEASPSSRSPASAA